MPTRLDNNLTNELPCSIGNATTPEEITAEDFGTFREPFPSVSQYTGPTSNADGSIDVYFGPTATAGKVRNWIRTVPNKGWFTLLRFYGPREEFFDQTWKPGDIVEENRWLN